MALECSIRAMMLHRSRESDRGDVAMQGVRAKAHGSDVAERPYYPDKPRASDLQRGRNRRQLAMDLS